MKLIALEKRLGRWVYKRRAELWGSLIVTLTAGGLITASFLGWIPGVPKEVAATSGFVFFWGICMGILWGLDE